MGKTNSNSNYKAKTGSLKSPQAPKKTTSTNNQKQTKTNNQKQTTTTYQQQKKATNQATTNYNKLNNNTTIKKQNNNNNNKQQKNANYYNNVNYSMPKKNGGYYTSPNYSMQKNNTITTIKTKVNTPSTFDVSYLMYNQNNKTELFNVETGTIENLKIKVDDIDLSRISASAYNAQNSDFVKVNEEIWKNADLNITERDDGTFLIKNGDVAIGFTDAKGLDSLLNGKNNGTQKTDETPTTPKTDGTQTTNNNETPTTQKEEEKPTNEQTQTKEETTTETKKYSQNEETGFEGGGFVLHSGYELDTVYKTIAAEGGNISPKEAKNIASVLINRARAGSGYGGGNDIYKLTIAPNQFEAYFAGHYKNQTLNEESRKAVDELFASCAEGGETTHDYTYFKSNDSTWYGGEILEDGGNRYKDTWK